jgi:Flp pilus assembly protein CpaB
VVGGLLVAASAVGLGVAYDAATRTDTVRYIVATADLPAGHTIAAKDLGFSNGALPEGVRAHTLSNPNALIGTSTVGPIAAGEIISSSRVRSAAAVAQAPGRRVSIDLPAARALGGALRAGDRVDVVGSGADAQTTAVIVEQALVESVETRARGGIGASGDILLTLVVADTAAATAIIDTVQHHQVTLIAASALNDTGGR